jgi:outer membrane receptor protein involved in Fe transport
MKINVLALFLSVLIYFTPSVTTANTAVSGANINGKIIDDQKQPLEFVNVSVRKKGTTGELLTGTITDSEGVFHIGKLVEAEYTFIASFVGYTTYTQDIKITSENQVIDIPTITMKEDVNTLKEVEVVGTRSQMRFEIDKKVFNVDQSIVSAGGAASDVLSNIPSVEVDDEGEISLRGSSSVTIWINGKASGLTADNRAQILEQMPAESIERIEVITNPSAKYSPEGTAGIINIILKQNRRAGYYGSAQAGGDSRGSYNANFNINYSSGKWEAFAGLGYRDRQNKRGGYTDRIYTDISDTTYLNQTSDGKGGGGNINARLGLTYNMTQSDHFYLSGFGMFGDRDNDNDIYYKSNLPGSYINSLRSTKSNNSMNGGNIEFGYKHDFNKTSNIELTVSHNIWNMNNTSKYFQNSLYTGNREETSYQKQKSDMSNNNWDVQLDYVTTINEIHKIEAGYKGTFSSEDSPMETYSGSNEANSQPTYSLFNKFVYDQNINAGYITYATRFFDKLGLQLGLRGENSSIKTKSPGYSNGSWNDNVPAYKKDYFSLFPSVFISYQLPSDNEIQVNYTRRISRPWGGQLNSFVNISDSTNISFGNPRLSPQYSNAFELNYIKNWDNHTISFSGYYRTTDDVIQRISFMEGNVMKSTFENIAQNLSAGAEFVVKNRFFRKLDLTTTINAYYYKLDGFTYTHEESGTVVIGKESDDFSWNARMIANVALPKMISLQITGNYNAKRTIAQGHQKANYNIDAGIRKSFNKISLSVNARDIFDSRKRHSVTSGSGFHQESENWWGGRQIGATVTYSFGNMKASRPNKRQMQEGNQTGGYDLEGNGEFQN